MSALFLILLFLHVLGAIVAFGPTFAFPMIGAMGGNEPSHSNFATRVSHRIGDRLVEPAALSMAVTGVGMILVAGIDVLARESRWLLLAIVLYIVGLTISFLVSRPAVTRIIELTGGHTAAPATGPGAPVAPSASAGPGGPGGPPPGLLEAVSRVQRAGMILLAVVVVIVFLMVVKPGLGF